MGKNVSYLDVNDDTLDAKFLEFLGTIGLKGPNEPLPAGMSAAAFRRRWEKWLWAQRPQGAAASGSSGESDSSSAEAEPDDGPPKPRKRIKLEAGALPDDVTEDEALRWGNVLLYEDEKFGGAVSVLPPGNYSGMTEVNIRNDSVTSVRIGKGVKLVMFKDAFFKGDRKDVLADTPNVGKDWNDQLTSAKVVPK